MTLGKASGVQTSCPSRVPVPSGTAEFSPALQRRERRNKNPEPASADDTISIKPGDEPGLFVFAAASCILRLTLFERGGRVPDKQVSKNAQSIRTSALNVTLTGKDRIQIETVAGQKIIVQGDDQGVIIQDASGDSIQLQAGTVQIRATSKVWVECSEVEISASAITVNAAMTNFSGTVQADTVIANNVVASSYTPGAGNVW